MDVQLTIGEFSKMTYLSVKALRHYHDVGVLEPAEVDPATGYRFYAPDQIPVAQVIRRLRGLGMPLDGIRAVLAAPDVDSRNHLIAMHAKRMETQLATAAAAVAELRSLLDRPPSPVPVVHRTLAPSTALAISESVAASELDSWWQTAFSELDAALAAAAVPSAGPRAALYSPEFFEVEAGEVIAFVPAAADTRSSGRVSVIEVPGVELAVATHNGGLATIDQTYGALGLYVAEREIGVAGPIRETYVVCAYDTDDESQHVTEVGWPVFRTA